jgi:hypothetical protein
MSTIGSSSRAFDLRQISERTSFGATFLRAEIKAGRLDAKRGGDKIIVTEAALIAWFNSLPSAIQPTSKKNGEATSE